MSHDTAVIAGADLDLLELTLGGAVENKLRAAGEATILTDPENTPLATLSPHPSADGFLSSRALRPFPTGRGVVWDETLRRSADNIRQEIDRKHTAAGGVLAVAFTEIPANDDLERVRATMATSKPRCVLWAALVGRASGSSDATADGEALIRATTNLRPDDAAIIPVIVPWATGADPQRLFPAGEGAELEGFTIRVLNGYGADQIYDVSETRPPETQDQIAGLDLVWRREAERLYPAESLMELERLRRSRQGSGQGLVVLLTGLSGSGKSTIARALAHELEKERPVTLLDGDEVHQMLSAGLGFDRAAREMNIRRIGYVAGLIAQHGGTVIAAPIAPFDDSRAYLRGQAEKHGRFLLIHVATSLEVCEARDRKGLYARARAGEIDDFTGISSPYEIPDDADLTIDTTNVSVDDAVQEILDQVG